MELKLPDFLGEMVNPLSKSDITPVEIAKPVSGTSAPNFSSMVSSPSAPDIGDAMVEKISNPQAYAQDKYKYGKNYSMDNDYTGHKFEKYYNTPGVYKQLGFSPWVDNESKYNDKITWFQDWKRAARQSASLAATGFKSMLPWNAWDMDLTDEKSAKEMERAHVLGQSSKKGVGGFFNNLTLDAGYTLGIGAEFAAEEVITWGAASLAAPETLGGSWVAALGKTAVDFRKGMTLVNRLGTLSDTAKKMYNGLDALKDVNKAREAYKYVKSGKPLEDLGKLLIPSTAVFAKDTYKSIKGAGQVFDLAHVAKGAGAFYRDARELAAAMSESKLEAGSRERETFQELSDKHFRETGRTPNDSEYRKIQDLAKGAGIETFMWNMPALWLSNKIVFDKALKGLPTFRNLRAGAARIADETLERETRNILTDKDVWKTIENTMSAKLKRLNPKTWNPAKILKRGTHGTLMYTARNLTEALQEQYQDAASQGIAEHYKELYSDPLATGFHKSWGYFSEKLGKQFTTQQGWETFASGFAMGAIVQGPQHLAYDFLPRKFEQIFNSDNFKAEKAKRAENVNNIVTALNHLSKDPKKYYNFITENLLKQNQYGKAMIDALDQGDVKTYKDLEKMAEFEHIYTLLQNDKIDLVVEYLNDLKQLSGEELEQAFGKLEETQGDSKLFYDNQVDGMIKTINYLKKRKEHYDDFLVNPFDPNKYSIDVDPERAITEYMNWKGYENIKKQAIIDVARFDNTLERMNKILDKASNQRPLDNTGAHDFSILFSPNELTNEKTALRLEIKNIDTSTPEGKKELKFKQEKLELISRFADAIITLKASRKKNDTIAYTDEEVAERRKSSEDMLRNIYGEYLTHLSQENLFSKTGTNYLLTPEIEESFQGLIDFYDLDAERGELAKRIEQLLNPKIFLANAKRESDILYKQWLNRLETFKKSVEAGQEDADLNDLMTALLNIGAFFDLDDLAALKTKFIAPKLINASKNIPLTPEIREKGNKLINTWIDLHKPKDETKPDTDTSKPDSEVPVDQPVTEFFFRGNKYQKTGDTHTRNGLEISEEDYLKMEKEFLESKKVIITPPPVKTDTPPEPKKEEPIVTPPPTSKVTEADIEQRRTEAKARIYYDDNEEIWIAEFVDGDGKEDTASDNTQEELIQWLDSWYDNELKSIGIDPEIRITPRILESKDRVKLREAGFTKEMLLPDKELLDLVIRLETDPTFNYEVYLKEEAVKRALQTNADELKKVEIAKELEKDLNKIDDILLFTIFVSKLEEDIKTGKGKHGKILTWLTTEEFRKIVDQRRDTLTAIVTLANLKKGMVLEMKNGDVMVVFEVQKTQVKLVPAGSLKKSPIVIKLADIPNMVKKIVTHTDTKEAAEETTITKQSNDISTENMKSGMEHPDSNIDPSDFFKNDNEIEPKEC